MDVDRDALGGALRRLEDVELDALEIAAALGEIVDAAADVLGITGTGLMVVDDSALLRYVAASDDPGRTLEMVQEAAGEGPCADTLIYGEVVSTDDLAADPRWPAISDVVV